MYYRIVAIVNVDQNTIPKKLYTFIKKNWGHAQTINEEQPDQEVSFIRLEGCFHDEPGAKPCELIKEITSLP